MVKNCSSSVDCVYPYSRQCWSYSWSSNCSMFVAQESMTIYCFINLICKRSKQNMLNFSYNLFTKCYQGNQTKDNVMGDSCIPNGVRQKRTNFFFKYQDKVHQEDMYKGEKGML